jgi:uncharacterized protein
MDNQYSKLNCNDIIFPPTIEILITTNCNLKCAYCFEKKERGKKIDVEKLFELFRAFPALKSFSLFGGEPLLAMDVIESVINYIENDTSINENTRSTQLNSVRGIITNGILVPKLIEKIKKNKLNLQLSFDGCRESHDINRVFPNGKETFDLLLETIKICKENDVSYSLHGVLTKNNLIYLFDTIKTMFNMILDRYEKEEFPIDKTIETMNRENWMQLNFEPEWDDADIDIFINELYKTCEWIYSNNDLTDKQKNDAFFAIIAHNRGGNCGAGRGFATIDEEFNLFPCHRISQWDIDKNPFKIGKIYDIDISNKKLWNSLYRIKYLYSSVFDTFPGKFASWSNWCPAANYETSGNIYYQTCKYNVLLIEVNEAINKLKQIYYITDEITW